MKKCAVVALALIAAVVLVPTIAYAETLPANGTITEAIPVTLSSTDVIGTTYASFRIDGTQVAYKRPVAVYTIGDEGERILTGYKASADVGVSDGLHTYEVWQGAARRYSGTFTVDGNPRLVDYWFEGVGSSGAMYFKFIDNDTVFTTNAYPYDKSGAGGALAPVSATTANGVTTAIRKLSHADYRCNMVQMLYGGEVHGCSMKITEGYSYPGDDSWDMTWLQYSAVEVCCPHWGDSDPETVMEHEEGCWHAPLEWAYGIYGP